MENRNCKYNKNKNNVIVVAIIFIALQCTQALPNNKDIQNSVKINKCCEKFEIFVDERCTSIQAANTTGFSPSFTGYDGKTDVKVENIQYLIGQPDCGKMQMWAVYDFPQNHDYLFLFTDGKLGHYIRKSQRSEEDEDYEDEDHHIEIKQLITERSSAFLSHDFEQGHYCLEKATFSNKTLETRLFAYVCSPGKIISWTDTDFILRKILNPLFHGISMIILLIIAIIYFVLPTLRDLVGNIITTITICLIISQAADLVRIFTEFSNHFSFMIADIILYASLLAAFFWLSSLGYYIWKTFKSRNVFLRVTDGRKYCYYSCYAWSMTGILTLIAIFAHFYLDTGTVRKQYIFEDQETIGWLGMAVFFTPVAFTIIINLFFYATTLKVMNRINSYGRIHNKLKNNFIMFMLIFLTMSVAWIFFILSWLKYDYLLYVHIITNALQAPILFYICIIRQKHVSFLLRKTCCYNEPVTHAAAAEWNYGDELTYMNGRNDY
ncbi:hypothetical protein PVAND_002806 [Polypedilum vanderplanki]|uniref:G-protein coupled receptors family 2 profile 2 domain-containing protein n=1 Tax=Polypedilum vanderplanki TaxID=319348 RepID=A0A9J6BS42_POLVA|nr:hypothetical protein PVAND_002806 [Polypedilum vanderplanki]